MITAVGKQGFVLDRESVPKAARKLVKTIKPATFVTPLDGWAFPADKLAEVQAFLAKHQVTQQGVKRPREAAVSGGGGEEPAEPRSKRARVSALPAADAADVGASSAAAASAGAGAGAGAAAGAGAGAGAGAAAAGEAEPGAQDPIGSIQEVKKEPADDDTVAAPAFNRLQKLPHPALRDTKVLHLNVRQFKCEECGSLQYDRSGTTSFHNPFAEHCTHVDFDGEIGCDHCIFVNDSGKWVCYECAPKCEAGCECDACNEPGSDDDLD